MPGDWQSPVRHGRAPSRASLPSKLGDVDVFFALNLTTPALALALGYAADLHMAYLVLRCATLDYSTGGVGLSV